MSQKTYFSLVGKQQEFFSVASTSLSLFLNSCAWKTLSVFILLISDLSDSLIRFIHSSSVSSSGHRTLNLRKLILVLWGLDLPPILPVTRNFSRRLVFQAFKSGLNNGTVIWTWTKSLGSRQLPWWRSVYVCLNQVSSRGNNVLWFYCTTRQIVWNENSVADWSRQCLQNLVLELLVAKIPMALLLTVEKPGRWYQTFFSRIVRNRRASQWVEAQRKRVPLGWGQYLTSG